MDITQKHKIYSKNIKVNNMDMDPGA